MSLFCRHDYRPHSVIAGQSLLGDVLGNEPIHAIAWYCVRCNRRRLDKGWSRLGAERQLAWLKSQTRRTEEDRTDDRL